MDFHLFSNLLLLIKFVLCNDSLFNPIEYDIEEEESSYKSFLRGNIISSSTKDNFNSAPLLVLNDTGNCQAQDRRCQLCEGHCEADSDCAEGKY